MTPAPTMLPERSVSTNVSRRAGREGVPGIVVVTFPNQRPVRSSDHGSGVAGARPAVSATGFPLRALQTRTPVMTASARPARTSRYGRGGSLDTGPASLAAGGVGGG